ncbi:hypothetical protein G9A89_023514 [Geosiphon pyriformis]|nr:hypothetical protein G9A89_023514 [Geosiphon pyriformis]
MITNRLILRRTLYTFASVERKPLRIPPINTEDGKLIRRVIPKPHVETEEIFIQNEIEAPVETQDQGFADLGIRQPICDALARNYNITKPTICQKLSIPPILKGRDVLIRDLTGSGKTFGVTLALLSKTRAHTKPHSKFMLRTTRLSPCITSVMVLPSRELAYQVENWVRMVIQGVNFPSIKPIIQVVARGEDIDPLQQVKDLADTPPHLLVGTATRIYEIVAGEHVDLSNVQTIFLDEVDHLLRLPKKYDPIKRIAVREAHPKPADLLTREVMKRCRKKPQIVVASATINHMHRFYLNLNEFVIDPIFVDITQGSFSPTTIDHHCLIVGSREIRNLKPRDEFPQFSNFYKSGGSENVYRSHNTVDFEDDNDIMLDNVCGAWEMENVQKAILFIPNQFTAPRVVSRLRSLGLPAKELTSFEMNTSRTGRMGKSGKVVSFVRDHGGFENKMRTMFKNLAIEIKSFEHVIL